MSQVNVLVVDDRPENLLAIESTLGGLGPHFEYVRSAEDALKYLLSTEVSLILLDVQMPEVSGFEFAELVRQREHTQDTPIIFISATSVDQEYVFKGYSLGAVDYLTKPFEPEILKSKVNFFTNHYLKNVEIRRQAAELEEANAALDALNEELEERVQQRAAEIEDAYRKLSEESASKTGIQTRLALEHLITRELSFADSLDTAAPAILKAFCSYLSADFSTLYLLSDDGLSLNLVHLEAVHGDTDYAQLSKSTRDGKFPLGVGFPGDVWEENRPVWGTISQSDSQHPIAKVAAMAGLQFAVGMPIKIGDDFAGMIEFFFRAKISEDPEIVKMFEVVGSEIGQFVFRRRVELERENLLTQEIMLRQQAEKASKLKDEFLATVSHELRTPLNSILGWTQILKRADLQNDSQTAAAVEVIFRNAKAQSQLIEDLLDMSRLITGNFPLDLTPTSIRSVIESAVGIVKPQAEAKSIVVSTNYTFDELVITCDTDRVQQMVWNLLANAIKFTPEGGAVTINADCTGESVTIAIVDNGQGIDPEFLPHVFDRFRQEDSTSTRKQRGLGLGLAIVTNLAELHGGHVAVESEGLGRGSKFTITLPTSGANTRQRASTSGPGELGKNFENSVDLNNIRILIVEDDVDASFMLSTALRALGADTRISHSVADALSSLTDWVPNALLADINMPDEDGYSFIKRVRRFSSPEIAGIPAIALTAMARPEDSDQALSSGFHLHIPKPVDIEDLTRSIAGLVRNRAYQGAQSSA